MFRRIHPETRQEIATNGEALVLITLYHEPHEELDRIKDKLLSELAGTAHKVKLTGKLSPAWR